MNCQEAKDRLYEQVGLNRLSDQLREHLADCEECSKLWEELSAIGEQFGRDVLFSPSQEVARDLLVGINETLDKLTQDEVTFVPSLWNRVATYIVPLAASLVLLLGVYRYGQWSQQVSFVDEYAEEILSDQSFWAENDAASEDLDQGTVSELLWDYTGRHSMEPSEMLLDDLTIDELEFLESNLDVKELL